jgi:ATP-dependent Clp protease adaptor protein ClpS
MSQPLLEPIFSEQYGNQGRWMVVIFNNATNSMDEVIDILMEATGCDVTEAYIETWEAHTYGKASVHFSSHEECETVAAIISTIGVKTEVTKEWPE